MFAVQLVNLHRLPLFKISTSEIVVTDQRSDFNSWHANNNKAIENVSCFDHELLSVEAQGQTGGVTAVFHFCEDISASLQFYYSTKECS